METLKNLKPLVLIVFILSTNIMTDIEAHRSLNELSSTTSPTFIFDYNDKAVDSESRKQLNFTISLDQDPTELPTSSTPDFSTSDPEPSVAEDQDEEEGVKQVSLLADNNRASFNKTIELEKSSTHPRMPNHHNRSIENDFNWPETQYILTTVSPQIRSQETSIVNSTSYNHNMSTISQDINDNNNTISAEELDDLIDVVSFMTNSYNKDNSTKNKEDELIANYLTDKETLIKLVEERDEQKDLEDSSSNVNTALVSSPKLPTTDIKAQETSSLHQDQIIEPSTTRIHQVWTASTSSDVDELSPDIIGRMQNNVPFLAAYAVRPRIVRASKSNENLSASSSSLVRLPATASNVDYSEIQVESSSLTSHHHHKKQTKLKRKKNLTKSSNNRAKLLEANLASTKQDNNKKRKLVRLSNRQSSLSQKREMLKLASRSLKSQRRRNITNSKQQNSKRYNGIKSAKNVKKTDGIRRKGIKSSSRSSQLRRKMNRNNRQYYMNAIKYGRYYQQEPNNNNSDMVSLSNMTMIDNVDNRSTVGDGTIHNTEPEDDQVVPSTPVDYGTKGGSTKGGSTGARRPPFYMNKNKNDEDQPKAHDGGAADDRRENESSSENDNNVSSNDASLSMSSNRSAKPLDDNPEVVSVEPKYDGVDDDPEYFDEGSGQDSNDGDRIDDVDEAKPNLGEDEPDTKSKEYGDEDSERIDGDEGRASRRDREESSGSQGKKDINSNMGDNDHPSDASSHNEDENKMTIQGDRAAGGDTSVLGGGIGSTSYNSNSDNSDNEYPKMTRDEADQPNEDKDSSKDNDVEGNRDIDKTTIGVNRNANGVINENQDRSLSNDSSNNYDDEDDKDKRDNPSNGNDLNNSNNKSGSGTMNTASDSHDKKSLVGDQDERTMDNDRPTLSNKDTHEANDNNDDANNRDNRNNINDNNNRKHLDDDQATSKKKDDNNGQDGAHHHEGNDHDHCEHHHHHDTIEWLKGSIPGEPKVDYPIFWQVPKTKFNCRDQKYPGYYGDVEARCQVFHVCQADGRQDSFLCPNGTIFSQISSVCVWWNSFDCEGKKTGRVAIANKHIVTILASNVQAITDILRCVFL